MIETFKLERLERLLIEAIESCVVDSPVYMDYCEALQGVREHLRTIKEGFMIAYIDKYSREQELVEDRNLIPDDECEVCGYYVTFCKCGEGEGPVMCHGCGFPAQECDCEAIELNDKYSSPL